MKPDAKIRSILKIIFFPFTGLFWLIRKVFRLIVWELAGLRLIWEKIRPPAPGITRRKPTAIGLWVFGLYILCYGIALFRYDARTTEIEQKASDILRHKGTPAFVDAFDQIGTVQHMTCPVRPVFLDPLWTFRSLFGTPWLNQKTAVELKLAVLGMRDNWDGVDLSGIDLSRGDLTGIDLNNVKLNGTNLSSTNLSKLNLSTARISHIILSKANLSGANLSGTNLTQTDLTMAYLVDANLKDADLTGSDLTGADLSWAILSNADLSDTILSDVDFTHTDLTQVKNLTIEQLRQVQTLYKATMDSTLKHDTMQVYPELFEIPSWLGNPGNYHQIQRKHGM